MNSEHKYILHFRRKVGCFLYVLLVCITVVKSGQRKCSLPKCINGYGNRSHQDPTTYYEFAQFINLIKIKVDGKSRKSVSLLTMFTIYWPNECQKYSKFSKCVSVLVYFIYFSSKKFIQRFTIASRKCIRVYVFTLFSNAKCNVQCAMADDGDDKTMLVNKCASLAKT